MGRSTSTTTGRPDSLVASQVMAKGVNGLLNLKSYAKNNFDLELASNQLIAGGSGLEMGVKLTRMPVAPYKTQIEYLADGTLVKSESQLTYGQSLTTDVIGDPSPYNSADTTTTLQSTSTDTGTELRANALSWNVDQMYKYIDTDDRDNVDLTVENYDDTAKWSKVYKGYPTAWLDRLAIGKSIGFNPLLVGQDGSDYIVSGSLSAILSSKATVLTGSDTVVYSTDFVNFAAGGRITNPVGNHVDAYNASSRLYIWSYTSTNKPLTHQSSLPVQKVLPKVIASNSHSVYQGAMVTNSATGKVSVGASVNGLTSKLLDGVTAVSSFDVLVKPDVQYTVEAGDTIMVLGFDNGDGLYERIVTSGETATHVSSDDFSTYVDSWLRLSNSAISTTPTHSTITLNADVSPASKYFVTEATDDNGEVIVQVFSEELINDGSDWGDEGNFQQLTTGTREGLNGAVQTKCLQVRTGFYKGDK